MFCLAANYNAPHNNTPMLGVHAREAGLACGFFCLQDYRPGSVITDVIFAKEFHWLNRESLSVAHSMTSGMFEPISNAPFGISATKQL